MSARLSTNRCLLVLGTLALSACAQGDTEVVGDGSIAVAREALWSDDTDTDGVIDGLDNCPRIANSNQANSNFIGPGDACELSLVLNPGAASKLARFQSHRELVTSLSPFTLTNNPNLLDFSTAPAGSTGYVSDLTQRLGVRRSGESLLSAPTFSGSEVLTVSLGNASQLGGAKADQVIVRLSGLGTVEVRFFDGATQIGTRTLPVPAVALYVLAVNDTAFTRIELRATSGSLSLQGYGEAIMFRLRNATLTCPPGYVPSGGQCVDINECADSSHGCDALVTCTNTPGSYECGTCPSGYGGNGQSGCFDIDECAQGTDACDELVTCANTAGGYQCGACPAGYAGDGFSCADIDECAAGTDGCDELVSCTNTEGSFECGECPSGYSGGGASGCTDIDECAADTDGCDELVACTNTEGSFECGPCPAGYTGDGATGCLDIDECTTGAAQCSPLVTCGNTAGGYTCGECPSGYTGDGFTCTDVDECAAGTDLCSELAPCINTVGGYTCGNCPSGYTGDGFTCTDIDECAAEPCDALTACGNTPGGYDCSACPSGYSGDGFSGCLDIDECASGTDACSDDASCSNLPGAYACTCNEGYEGDGLGCADIDECSTGSDDCAAEALCTNTAGGFTCACSAGYEGDGVVCTDIDECALDMDDCAPFATCVNTPGSFDCTGCEDDDDSCDGVDQDCDGTADEGYLPPPTSCGVGACGATGELQCIDGAPFNTCTPGSPSPDDDCDAVDDDCDGVANDDYLVVCTGSTMKRVCSSPNSERDIPCSGGLCDAVECTGGCNDSTLNRLRNPSFETVPSPPQFGQALMPTEWRHVELSADVWSTDGSYGLAPGEFGHFTGMSAQDGNRWVAGASFPESFNQQLTARLANNASYRVSAWLLQNNNFSYDSPGSYRFTLTQTASPAGAVLGTFAPTSSNSSWAYRELCFTAPADANTRPFLLLTPTTVTGANTYPGIDNMQLIEVCGCN